MHCWNHIFNVISILFGYKFPWFGTQSVPKMFLCPFFIHLLYFSGIKPRDVPGGQGWLAEGCAQGRGGWQRDVPGGQELPLLPSWPHKCHHISFLMLGIGRRSGTFSTSEIPPIPWHVCCLSEVLGWLESSPSQMATSMLYSGLWRHRVSSRKPAHTAVTATTHHTLTIKLLYL